MPVRAMHRLFARFGPVLWTLLMSLAIAHAQSSAPPEAPLARQLAPVPVGDTRSQLAPQWHRGALLQVYVRAYQDSDGDGVGDLRGLVQRLDYIQALGVRGIWLMPIFRSQDQDHGYAVADYRDIDPDLGTLADFDHLVQQAHARGLGVVLDYTPNHSAADHPLFEASRSARHGPYRDWYVWADQAPEGWNIYGKNPWYPDEHGWYFAGFSDQMPEFNWRKPEVLAWHQDNLRFWLNRGVDGFRFDAVGNLVENGPYAWEGQEQNHSVMAALRATVQAYERRFVVCEAPGDPVAFAAPTSCGASFAFGHHGRVVAAALGDAASVERVAPYYLPSDHAGMVGFASNHDGFAGQRLWDRMGGDAQRYRLAAATYLLQSPTAVVYYGEEIGMSGGLRLGGDHKLRAPMSWAAPGSAQGFSTEEPFRAYAANQATHHVQAQLTDPDSLLHFYRRLLALRNAHPALAWGDTTQAASQDWMMGFVRRAQDRQALVLINYGARRGQLRWQGLPPKAWLRPLWNTQAAPVQADARGHARLRLGAARFEVYEVQP
ncbi:MAG: alpha-amylase family glycosyl hydrolase [Rhodoferax sp.]